MFTINDTPPRHTSSYANYYDLGGHRHDFNNPLDGGFQHQTSPSLPPGNGHSRDDEARRLAQYPWFLDSAMTNSIQPGNTRHGYVVELVSDNGSDCPMTTPDEVESNTGGIFCSILEAPTPSRLMSVNGILNPLPHRRPAPTAQLPSHGFRMALPNSLPVPPNQHLGGGLLGNASQHVSPGPPSPPMSRSSLSISLSSAQTICPPQTTQERRYFLITTLYQTCLEASTSYIRLLPTRNPFRPHRQFQPPSHPYSAHRPLTRGKPHVATLMDNISVISTNLWRKARGHLLAPHREEAEAVRNMNRLYMWGEVLVRSVEEHRAGWEDSEVREEIDGDKKVGEASLRIWAISIDALSQEQAFTRIRVFERREKAGGCWISDPEERMQRLPDFEKLAVRTPDDPLPIPEKLPSITPHIEQYRFSETSIYPTLETNIDAFAMSFSQEHMSSERSALNISRHGPSSPFRHWKVVESYIQSLVSRHNYNDLISYNTTVELISKNTESGKWDVTLRQPLENGTEDIWWSEEFDAVLVAAGHYHVPFIPSTPGLSELACNFPGSVQHSKAFRNPELYRGKKVVVVGASISGADISFALADIVAPPLHSVVRGKYHPYFSDHAFQHPLIERHPPISHVRSSKTSNERSIIFSDGTSVHNIDYIIFGTGYSWTLPFYPAMAQTIKNNRLPNLYQHIFYNEDPSLVFVGAVAAGFTFKVFEWQAVLAARYLAGRVALPALEERRQWERDRVERKGDGVPFTALYPDFDLYFEESEAFNRSIVQSIKTDVRLKPTLIANHAHPPV
ncbi:hypothetical protein B7494_g1186 [Chlorociboria aeruginascens]|nr:hypothetical protein B7494_g1186 [Chlorociboria aeruginascens]